MVKNSTILFRRNHYMFEALKALHIDEEGATMVEYGVIVGLIAVVCIVAVTLLGNNVKAVFNSSANSI